MTEGGMTEGGTLVAGRYRLLEQLAVGGMGVVWLGRDERLHRTVAVKQLFPQPGVAPEEAELAAQRAMREARITARLHHPSAVPVYDIVEHDGRPCLVMQYLPSTSLQELLAEKGPLPPARVVQWASEIAAALAAAHEAGIVHRDVKPGNVLIGEDGKARITDFGIAHALGDVTVTSTGLVTGTPAFLAPEAARGVDSGYAADVFSLGATLYAAVEGTPPFGNERNPMALLHRVASGGATPPGHAGPLTPLLTQMLADDPQERPSMRTVAEESAAIAELVDGRASSAPTQQFTAPVNVQRRRETAAPPPSATPPVVVRAAPAAHPARVDRPGRHNAWLVAMGLLVVGALIAGLVLALRASNDQPNASSSKPVTTGAHRSSSGGTSSSTAPSHSSSESSAASTRAGTPPPASGLAQAIVDYYGLLPGDTDAAWARLTPGFQNGRAGGRENFDAFWDQIESVSATDAQAVGAGTVDATVHYAYRDGHAVDERTRFHLVEQDGIQKIAATEVLG